jgi:hypothetical protein
VTGALGLFVAFIIAVHSNSTRLELGAAPRPGLTPGAVVPLTRDDVCGGSSFAQAAMVPPSLKRQVFEVYGIANPQPDAYEVDYLITPDLGGATNIRNLWPEPYHNTTWHAGVKDQLEERLHMMVCDGELDLATAQHEIATNWIAAYKKYFHTQRPLAIRPRAFNQPTSVAPVLLSYGWCSGSGCSWARPWCWHCGPWRGSAQGQTTLAGVYRKIQPSFRPPA